MKRSWGVAAAVVFAIAIAILVKRRVSPPSLPPTEKPLFAVFPPPTSFIPPQNRAMEEVSDDQKRACESTYHRFFSNSNIDIRLVFGYKDARPARFVGDRYEAAIAVTYLTAPCVTGWHACGFTRSLTDPQLFFKYVTGDDGHLRHIRLAVHHSSAGPDDDANRVDPFQKYLSGKAADAFYDGIEKADAVLYNGHSRDGGGPDFTPPRLTESRHTDYVWYRKNRPGMERLLHALHVPDSPLKLLGMFSCASAGHFLKQINAAKKDLGSITSQKLIYYSDALRNMLGALSALLGKECTPGFSSAMSARAEVGSSKLTGFFR